LPDPLIADLRFGARETRRDPDAMTSRFPSIEGVDVVLVGRTVTRTLQ
jgi:hypothetical protein